MIDEFKEVFNLYGYEDCSFHTIDSLINIDTNETLIKYDYWKLHNNPSEKRQKEIYDYKRPSDGKPFNSIPFSEMTPEENALNEELNQLPFKYAD